MKLSNYNRNSKKQSILAPAVFVSVSVMLIILVVVLYLNKDALNNNNEKTNHANTGLQNKNEKEDVKDSTLNPDDVWSQVIAGPNQEIKDEAEDNTKEENAENADDKTDKDTQNGGNKQEEKPIEETHTLVTYHDGKTEWLKISQYVKKNKYLNENFVYENEMCTYYENGEKVSFLGITLDKQQGIIDFNKVKKEDIDFVMIKIGQRGYQTGTLSIDDNFAYNMRGAINAGLKVGVYFESYAITKAEALEEAEFVLQYLADYDITYPVVFMTKDVYNDTTREDDLTKINRTDIARTFLDKIKEEGYIAMLGGRKERLLKKYDVNILDDYDFWLIQENQYPDYPYVFTMWQYGLATEINGIPGNVLVNISFIDFTIK